jgi:purine catabolism regulator
MAVITGSGAAAARAAFGDLAPFTLGDLLAEPTFGLRLLTGGDSAHLRPVGGAHAIEINSPNRWLDRDWVMLTAGLQLDDDHAQQARLIAQLDDDGIAALGFCIGAVHGAVPTGMVDEAERRGFPIFTVPMHTPFREIISLVHRNLMSDEIRAFSRMTAMQRFLMDSIGEENPKETVAERLASLVGAKVGLLQPSGRFEVATAELPGKEILGVLEGRHAMSVAFTVAGLHGHAFPIGGPESDEMPWLIIAAPEHRALHPLAKAAGNATLPLLAAMARLDRAQRLQDEAARRATLDALLEAEGREGARVLAAQAAVWGVDICDGVAGLVVEDATGKLEPEDVRAKVAAAGDRLGTPVLTTVRDGTVCALAPAPVTDEMLETALLGGSPGLRAGVGRTVTDPLAVAKSLSEAELAVGACEDASVGRYDDLDLGTVLVKELPLDRLAPKIDAWLEPLRSNPRVFETLVAYFRHNLDVGRTAQALHLHPNSVRYRLARAEALIGGPVRSPTTMIALQVAIMSETPGEARLGD